MSWKSLLFAALLFGAACGTTEPTEPAPREYVIRPWAEGGTYGFSAVEVGSGAETRVAAVRELEGAYYLPTMSRLPSFNRKVVRGYATTVTVPEAGLDRATVFVVTAMVRDTTVATVGR